MNPYIQVFSPHTVGSVERARKLIGYFNAEAAVLVANELEAEDNKNAILDVLIQRHPELKQDLDALAFAARILGTCEGYKIDLDRMQTEFISALPSDIKKQLP